MNTNAGVRMDKATFLHWAERQEGRFELEHGAPTPVAPSDRLHSRVRGQIQLALDRRLDRARWSAIGPGFALDVGDNIRDPDIIVEAQGLDPKATFATTPVLLVEVLSPSSIALDMNVKAAEYMSLASLETYIVAAQDEPRLWVWNRTTEAGRAWPKAPLEVHGRDKAVPVPSLGVELPMAEIYAALPA